MPRHRSAHTAAIWGERLQRFGPDQSVAAFCANEGVSTASFYNWRRRLKNAKPCDEPDTRPEGERSIERDGAAISTGWPSKKRAFQQVEVVSSQPGVAVRFTNGVRIDIDAGDEVTLKTVIRELMHAAGHHNNDIC